MFYSFRPGENPVCAWLWLLAINICLAEFFWLNRLLGPPLEWTLVATAVLEWSEAALFWASIACKCGLPRASSGYVSILVSLYWLRSTLSSFEEYEASLYAFFGWGSSAYTFSKLSSSPALCAIFMPPLWIVGPFFLNEILEAGIYAAKCLCLISCTLSRLSKLPPLTRASLGSVCMILAPGYSYIYALITPW